MIVAYCLGAFVLGVCIGTIFMAIIVTGKDD